MNNYNYDRLIDDVIYAMEKNHSYVYKNYVSNVYKYAKEKHKGQQRKSGEPYIKHPLRVAYYVAIWGLETDCVCAALLHDVVEDCHTPISEIEETFNPGIAHLVKCVTSIESFLSDTEKNKLTKEEIDRMSDAFLLENMTRKALLIKIADRLDNLNTIDCFDIEKQFKKARHTRDIIVELAKKSKAFYLADELENLCLKIEDRPRFDSISQRYNILLTQNITSVSIFENRSTELFKSIYKLTDLSIINNLGISKKEIAMLTAIRNFKITKRTISSLNRSLISKSGQNIQNFEKAITKAITPLLDISIVIDDSFLTNNPDITPRDIFYVVYDKFLIPQGVRIITEESTKYKDSSYIVIRDLMNNLYRVFIQSNIEYARYKIGDIVDYMDGFNIKDVDKTNPIDFNNMIKVYRRDGSEMYIDRNATVLDFAFAIHTDVGLSFDYAIINGTGIHHNFDTRIEEGDQIEIHQSTDIKPTIGWFRYTNTSRARNALVDFFTPTKKQQ